MGGTVSLTNSTNQFEWLAGRSSEFEVLLGSHRLGLMDFGEIEWAEENSPVGATLVVRKKRPGLEILIRTLAFHDRPGMERRFALINVSDQTICLGPVCLEILRFRCGVTAVKTSSGGLVLLHEDPAGKCGLMIGAEAGCVIEPRGEEYVIVFPEKRQLPPTGQWALPGAFLFSFTGEVNLAMESAYAEFRRHCAQRPIAD